MNKVILMGNLTQDPELKAVGDDNFVLNISIATNKKIKQWDEWVNKGEFHNLVIWGKRAEFFAKYLVKWSKVLIDWELQTRSWEKEDGTKMYKTEVLVNNFELAGTLNNSENAENTKQVSKVKAESKNTPKPKPKTNDDEIGIEDIPF